MAALELQLPVQTSNNTTQSGDDEKIWTRILAEVSSKGASHFTGSLVVLGEKESGKTNLLNKIEKVDAPRTTSALEYHCVQVQSDLRDGSYAYQLSGGGAGLGPAEASTLPVWILDGEPAFAPLLQFALPQSLARTVVMFTVSFDQPNPVKSLEKWYDLLNQQIKAKYEKKDIDEAKKSREYCFRFSMCPEVRFWQEYVEPVESSMVSSMITGFDDSALLPLQSGTLDENCGASVIVVVTKSDLTADVSEQQCDRVLYHLRFQCLHIGNGSSRKFCIAHGAALVYTSSKNQKNIQTLYKYIVHRAYALPFTSPAQLIEKDSIFVPAGWDTEKKLDIIREAVPDVDQPLESASREKATTRETLIEAEDDQAFLQRLSHAEPLAHRKKDVEDAPVTSDSPLASFFSNLLKDKPNTGASPKSSTAGKPVGTEEFERLLASSKGTPTKSADSGSDSTA